jgi:hypothetical protein
LTGRKKERLLPGRKIMKPFMYDHIQSVESLSGGNVRITAVVPESLLTMLKDWPTPIDHAARFLEIRNRCSKASQSPVYAVNSELGHII